MLLLDVKFMCIFLLQWLRSLVCPSLSLECWVPSSPSRHPAPSTSCPCCCASDSAAVTCPSLRRYTNAHTALLAKTYHDCHEEKETCSNLSFCLISSQTLDSSELEGDGIILSLEEQLNALSLSSSPSASNPKDTVALNGTRFSSKLFEDTNESTKVGIHLIGLFFLLVVWCLLPFIQILLALMIVIKSTVLQD